MLLSRLDAKNSYRLFYLLPHRTFCNVNSAQLQKKILPLHKHFYEPTCRLSWTSCIMTLQQSVPVITFQNYLINVHDYTGLPWWMIIMLTTFGIRSCIVFPLSVHQNQVIARLQNLNQELLKMAPELNKEVNMAAKIYNWDKMKARKVFKYSMDKYYQKFVVRDNCHPFKSIILVIFQIPIWICFSMSLRNITYMNFPDHFIVDPGLIFNQLSTEGVLWFTNLTMPDRIFIPLLLLTVNIALTEIHALRRVGEGSLFQKVFLNMTRCVSVALAAAAMFNPTSVTFYWLCSSAFGFCQNMILMTPAVRRVCNIPLTSTETSSPFQTILNNFKKKLKR